MRPETTARPCCSPPTVQDRFLGYVLHIAAHRDICCVEYQWSWHYHNPSDGRCIISRSSSAVERRALSRHLDRNPCEATVSSPRRFALTGAYRPDIPTAPQNFRSEFLFAAAAAAAGKATLSRVISRQGQGLHQAPGLSIARTGANPGGNLWLCPCSSAPANQAV